MITLVVCGLIVVRLVVGRLVKVPLVIGGLRLVVGGLVVVTLLGGLAAVRLVVRKLGVGGLVVAGS